MHCSRASTYETVLNREPWTSGAGDSAVSPATGPEFERRGADASEVDLLRDARSAGEFSRVGRDGGSIGGLVKCAGAGDGSSERDGGGRFFIEEIV